MAEITLPDLRKNDGYIRARVCRRNWGSSASRLAVTVHQIGSKNISKNSLYFYQILLPLHTYYIRQHKSGQRLTQSEYTLQQIIVLFRELLSQLVEVGLTHTYHDVFRVGELKYIDYVVLGYVNTGELPFKEWAEEWLHKGEV